MGAMRCLAEYVGVREHALLGKAVVAIPIPTVVYNKLNKNESGVKIQEKPISKCYFV